MTADPPDYRPKGWNPVPADPDVRPVGWVTEQPMTTVRRRRSPFLLAVGVLLVGGAAVGLALAIIGLASSSGYDDEDIVAEGTVAALDGPAAASARFTSGGSDPYTVWIRTDGIFESNRRENVIAATACDVALPGGDHADFQGNRQGNAITINDDSTVGWFTAAEGQIEVICHQEPFGQRRTRSWLDDEHEFIVVAGKPAAPWAGMIVLGASVVGLLIGIAALTRWHRGRIVRV